MTDAGRHGRRAGADVDLESEGPRLAALRAGDAAAFAGIVQVWSPMLVRTALALTGDRDRAEALVRDTWLQMLSEVSTFQPPPGLRAWVCSLMVRRVGAVPARGGPPVEPEPPVEAARFRPPGDAEWPGHWALPPAPWPALEDGRPADRGIGQVLRAALEDLPQPERVVVGLRDVAGCDVAEIVQILGRPAEQVRALLNHGRARVRSRLEGHFAPQPA